MFFYLGCHNEENFNYDNFYPSGYRVKGKNFISCNHMRAIETYIEAYYNKPVNYECEFMAYKCSSYSSFLAGKRLSNTKVSSKSKSN